MATPVIGTEYQKILAAIENYYGRGSDQWYEFAQYGMGAENLDAILSQVPNVNVVKNQAGEIISYEYMDYASTATSDSIDITDIMNQINSNTQTGTASPSNNTSIAIPSNSTVDSTTQKVNMSSGATKVSGGTTVNAVATRVMPAIAAAGWGIKLGKTIDSTLYNLNPDFWDSNGMGAINPETWGSITCDLTEDDFPYNILGSAFNMIFGIDPATNDTIPYIDENAAAYITAYLNEMGAFSTGGETIPEEDPSATLPSTIAYPIEIFTSDYAYTKGTSRYNVVVTDSPVKMLFSTPPFDTNGTISMTLASESPFKYIAASYTQPTHPTPSIDAQQATVNGKTFYAVTSTAGGTFTSESVAEGTAIVNNRTANTPYISTDTWKKNAAYLMLYGSESSSPLDGVTDQEDATIPELTPGMTVPEVLDVLKDTYPDLWDDAIEQTVVQPDGTEKTITYIPTQLPFTNIGTDTQPTTGDQRQDDPAYNPETLPDIIAQLIPNLINPNPPTDTDIPDTGDGDTPPSPAPTGSASSLWAVYNPTQGQLDSFGAWLWSSNFVEQIKKLFNDPMQAIIGISKVYATPATGGAQSIKVGYLDSGVSSAVVTNQYTTIDCGTVTLAEYFGNVFDYAPFTQVSLFLPFIGIVELDVAEVMRSSINVTYHVDVISGACLAEVSVIRDGSGGVLYTYSGNAAVQYPFSAGNYASMVAGTLSIAAGIAGTVASGGAMAPALLGAAGAAGRLHTNVQHSGSFSGNAGAMGGKIPYLIIKRPQTKTAVTFPGIDGYPTNYSTTVGSCTGYIRCENCHVDGIPATFEELEQIESMLKDGVIV